MKFAAEHCPLCGGANDCQLGSGADGRDDCGCEQASISASLLALQSGDFYLDQGRMVFCGAYHLRRGYCCDNGCRHCPYPVSP